MEEVINFITTNWKFFAIVIAGFFMLVFTVFGIIVSRLVSRRVTKARSVTFTKCPHCGEMFTLSECDFILPSGEVDNDLNGVPDSQERSKK